MKKITLFTILFISLLLLSGCSHTVKKVPVASAGVYKSFDRGETWLSKAILAVAGGTRTIKDANIKVMKFDPQDNNAIYLGTENRGLFYSYNGGEYWQQPAQLSSGRINDVSVDPENKCTIFVAYGNKVMKSVDCNRSWFDAYIDPRPKTVTSIVIDNQDSDNIYVATDFGEVIKSVDNGLNWTTVNRFNKAITQLVINTKNARILYAVVLDQGIFKTSDAGNNWENITESIKKNKGIFTNAKLFFNETEDDGIYLISKYGIIRSDTGGDEWEILSLITPPLSTDIHSFGYNRENGNQIYYGTSSTIYRSNDRGVNWSVKKLPTTGIASYVLIDPVNPSILYLGTKIIVEKKK